MNDKNLTLALRRVRKSVRTNVDTGVAQAKLAFGSTIRTGCVGRSDCRPTLTCG